MIFNTVKKLEKLLNELYEVLVQKSFEYDGTKEKYDELEMLFNKYYDLRHRLEKKTGNSYFKNFDGVPIYVAKYEPHLIDISEKQIKEISKQKKAYTQEEAETLLNWTVNNTRKNIELECRSYIEKINTTGLCGFSQFSTLYPLQQLGLKVTYNNVGQFGIEYRHAFGTVTIPIIQQDSSIKDTTYLIDVTYSQFFTLDYNVKNWDEPRAGYYMIQNKDTKDFAEDLLDKGYVECTEENLNKYAYGFCLAEKKELPDTNIIFNEEDPTDYSKEEFDNRGYNLEIEHNKKKL